MWSKVKEMKERQESKKAIVQELLRHEKENWPLILKLSKFISFIYKGIRINWEVTLNQWQI